MRATGFAAPMGRGGRGSASPLHGLGGAFTGRATGTCRWFGGSSRRPVGVRRCLTRRPAQGRGMTPSPGYGWRSRRGWAPAVRPGLKPRAESPSPLKGAVRRPGARVDRLGAGAVVDQPASAGLGTEPGRSRPGDRGYSRSADPRCVSCETCRPRGIAASMARAGEATPRPDTGGAACCRWDR
jgi:hypothetical protein